MFGWFGKVSFVPYSKVQDFALHLKDGRLMGSRWLALSLDLPASRGDEVSGCLAGLSRGTEFLPGPAGRTRRGPSVRALRRRCNRGEGSPVRWKNSGRLSGR